MKVDAIISELSKEIAERSFSDSSFFPIDRKYIKPYLSKISELDKVDFIIYNLETTSNTFSVHFFLCLPEVWGKISVSELITIIERLKNPTAFFGLIEFTYKFIEIDLMPLIFERSPDANKLGEAIRSFLKRQYTNLIKFNSDYDIMEKVMGDVNYEDWLYIKEKLLLDARIKPALKSVKELEDYVNQL